MIKADFLNTAWVVIPATGIGVRAGMHHPKQYLKINDHSILDHTIDIFKQIGFKNILVILNSNDTYFQYPPDIQICIGREARYLSVGESLKYLAKNHINKECWILVHDAVRPCLATQDLKKLISMVLDNNKNNNNFSGGILAKKLSDTLKYAENNAILKTISRNNLWQALTPQLFKLGLLEQAYENINNFSESELNLITDEAYLVEKLGLMPLIVEANFPNPKLTTPQDIDYIKFLLEKKTC
jgi:2-C-methyl-D-erythritol 4-phosphate cytidylyltransferase